MNDNKTFRNIVEWMLATNKKIATNDILKLACINIGEYQVVMDENSDGKLTLKTSTQVNIQNFNKKYYQDYQAEIVVNKLEDDPDWINVPILKAGETHKIKDIPVILVKEKPVEAEAESMAVHNLLKDPERVDKRKTQRAQERIFHEQHMRLRDVTPDHMTFEIFIKYR